MTPGVSILLSLVYNAQQRAEILRLALEVLHYIQKPVVHVGLFNKADLDLIKIAQSILSMNVSQIDHDVRYKVAPTFRIGC